MQNLCVGRFNLHFCVVCSCSRESHVLSTSRDSVLVAKVVASQISQVPSCAHKLYSDKTGSQVVPTIHDTKPPPPHHKPPGAKPPGAKPPGAKPRARRYVRVGCNKIYI